MSLIEVMFFVIGFFVLYGGMCFIGFVVDKLLRRVFGFGIFPEGYFE
jgi:hypothetical protein